MTIESTLKELHKIKAKYEGKQVAVGELRIDHMLEDVIPKIELSLTLINAINAFIGQSGEYDGYLGCYAVSSLTHEHCQMGDVVSSVDELIEWYKENYPEEVKECTD